MFLHQVRACFPASWSRNLRWMHIRTVFEWNCYQTIIFGPPRKIDCPIKFKEGPNQNHISSFNILSTIYFQGHVVFFFEEYPRKMFPIASMYGILTYIYHILPLKTTKCRYCKYAIHGWYGFGMFATKKLKTPWDKLQPTRSQAVTDTANFNK